MSQRQTQIALVGDLHSSWDEADVRYFNQSDYRTILFTGDLGGSKQRDGVRVAQSLARLEREALVMLGNNDAAEYARIMVELKYQAGRADLLSGLTRTLPPASSPERVMACGFSAHRLGAGGFELTLIAARPFAMGGSELSYAAALEQAFGVKSLEESTERLKALVDAADTEHLMFLAHNGPAGLGADATAPFGRDFAPGTGDWGDLDLASAVAHAKGRGRRVRAVVAGHMHWVLRSGGLRTWRVSVDDTLYVNAALVPRHASAGRGVRRHHIALALSEEGTTAEEVWVSG